MTKAKLVIFRHGQTDYNARQLITGQIDVPLNATGEEQAREAGGQIKSTRFDKVYSSNLQRAFNTAALALDASKTQTHLLNTDGSWQIEQRAEIAELDAGDFSGRNHKTDPEILEMFGKFNYETARPGGESKKQVVERVRAFYLSDVLPRLEQGENVLIVAHAGIVRLFDIAIGLEEEPTAVKPMTHKKVGNAAPVEYVYENGKISHATPKKGANRNKPKL